MNIKTIKIFGYIYNISSISTTNTNRLVGRLIERLQFATLL